MRCALHHHEINEREALRRPQGVADVLLVHDRPILRHADDSIGGLRALMLTDFL